jgi:hypothetical protein
MCACADVVDAAHERQMPAKSPLDFVAENASVRHIETAIRISTDNRLARAGQAH